MITAQYSCAGCGVKNREVQVPARTTEDVCHWMSEIVAQCVADDHATVSPQCKSSTMTELKIPMPEGTEFIGQQVE